ncbi:MAG: LysR family transcriptional regulator [Pseudomonadota bacterium]
MLGSRLTVKHLQMIHAIDAADTLTEAADLLSISQPALSGRLHDAEETLGVQLFVRRGRRLNLSPAGQLLLPTARRILAELVRVETEIGNLAGPAKKALRIGMPQYASYSWLPAAVREFEVQFPAVEIEIVSEAATAPTDALSRGDIDVALISSPDQALPIKGSDLQSRLLLRDEFVALLPADHPKANLPFLEADDFLDQTYITNSAIPERNREYELFFSPNAVRPRRVVQVGFTGPITGLVAAGFGTTIITRWILQYDDRLAGVVNRPLTKSGLFVNWFAVHKRETTPPIDALCQIIAANGPGDG